MQKENGGSVWYECQEPYTLAIRIFGDSDIDLKRELYHALESNEDTVWKNTPRTYGQPPDMLYTYDPPTPGQELQILEETEEEEVR